MGRCASCQPHHRCLHHLKPQLLQQLLVLLVLVLLVLLLSVAPWLLAQAGAAGTTASLAPQLAPETLMARHCSG